MSQEIKTIPNLTHRAYHFIVIDVLHLLLFSLLRIKKNMMTMKYEIVEKLDQNLLNETRDNVGRVSTSD